MKPAWKWIGELNPNTELGYAEVDEEDIRAIQKDAVASTKRRIKKKSKGDEPAERGTLG